MNDDIKNFKGKLSDKDVYDILIKSGIINENLLTVEEFMIMRDFLNAGYSEEEAFTLAKGYGISENYRQSSK